MDFLPCRSCLYYYIMYEFRLEIKLRGRSHSRLDRGQIIYLFNDDILTTFNVTFSDRTKKDGGFIKHSTDYKAFRHAIVITFKVRNFSGYN